jgi:hypothetical protein
VHPMQQWWVSLGQDYLPLYHDALWVEAANYQVVMVSSCCAQSCLVNYVTMRLATCFTYPHTVGESLPFRHRICLNGTAYLHLFFVGVHHLCNQYGGNISFFTVYNSVHHTDLQHMSYVQWNNCCPSYHPTIWYQFWISQISYHLYV